MKALAALTFGLFMIMAVAGCVGTSNADSVPSSSGPAPAAAPAEFDETTGGVEGVIHDENLAPIAGAQVAIGTSPPITGVSDEAGKFSFSHVPAGEQKIFASKLGFNSVGKTITVAAGQVTAADLALTVLPVNEPYHETQLANGLFGCGASWRPAVVYSGISVCGALDGTPANVVEDEFLVTFKVGGNITNIQSLVYDGTWQSSQIFGAGMSYPVEPANCPNADRFFGPHGHSPVHAALNASDFATHVGKFDACGKKNCSPDKCTIMSRAFSDPDTLGASAPGDVGITFSQKFTGYLTEFYFEEAAPTFTALPDQ